MSDSLMTLLGQMKTARAELNRTTTLASSLRNKAIQLEAEVVTATEVTLRASEFLRSTIDPSLLEDAKKVSEEAVQTLMETARFAAESLKAANDADAHTSQAFINVKKASERLAAALKKEAATLSFVNTSR